MGAVPHRIPPRSIVLDEAGANSLYSTAGSMSSDAKVTVASNCLVGAVTTEVLLQLLVVSPLPVHRWHALGAPLPPCAALHTLPLTTSGSPRGTASEAGARRLNWVVVQLRYMTHLHLLLSSVVFSYNNPPSFVLL
jgi:hypothetical protein